ncbi:MAG: S-layer homology domain-containing protein [Succiniclasticum sp.]|jgi:hypothetical protein
MKKSLVLAMAMALGVTASAYAANPFSDVPAGHWAYDSIAKLAAAGVIDGYGDTTFKGDRLMTRYEMAQIVAKAMAKGANVDKLAAEFADELDALGVRVAALEKKSDNVKITGQIRYSYEHQKFDKDDTKYSKARLRTRLIFTGKVNDNWDYVARVENNQYFHNSVDGDDYKGDDDVSLNHAYLTGNLGAVHLSAGRQDLWLADGMVYDDLLDGVQASVGDKYQFSGFYGKVTGAFDNTEDDPSDSAWGVNFNTALGHVTNLFAGYTEVSFKNGDSLYTASDNDNKVMFNEDKAKITNAGLKVNLTDDIALTGGYLHTNAEDNNNGWYAVLDLWGADYKKPGSFGFEAVYYDQPAMSAQMHTMSADLYETSLASDGFKGYQVAASYTVAKNMMASVQYYDLESKEDSGNEVKAIWSEFQLRF